MKHKLLVLATLFASSFAFGSDKYSDMKKLLAGHKTTITFAQDEAVRQVNAGDKWGRVNDTSGIDALEAIKGESGSATNALMTRMMLISAEKACEERLRADEEVTLYDGKGSVVVNGVLTDVKALARRTGSGVFGTWSGKSVLAALSVFGASALYKAGSK